MLLQCTLAEAGKTWLKRHRHGQISFANSRLRCLVLEAFAKPSSTEETVSFLSKLAENQIDEDALVEAMETLGEFVSQGSMLSLGSEVRIHGLQSEAGKQLDGRCGIVVKPIEVEGRFAISVKGAGTKLIKKSNLGLVENPRNTDEVAKAGSPTSVSPIHRGAQGLFEDALEASLRHTADTAAAPHGSYYEDRSERRDGHGHYLGVRSKRRVVPTNVDGGS